LSFFIEMSSSDSSSSGPGSGPKRFAAPQSALDALLVGAAGDPVRRALWLDALDQRLRTCLPPPLAAHARLANVDRDRLVYLVDAPVWHAKLRMHGPQLLDAARSLGLQVTTLTVRINRAPESPQDPARQRVEPMSASARQALDAALASLTDAQHGRKPSTGRNSD
jgi:hypothetical protein